MSRTEKQKKGDSKPPLSKELTGDLDLSAASAVAALSFVRRFLSLRPSDPEARLILRTAPKGLPVLAWSDGSSLPLKSAVEEDAVLEQLDVALSASGRPAATGRVFSQTLWLRLREAEERGVPISEFPSLAELAQKRRTIDPGLSPWLRTLLSRLLNRMPGLVVSEDGRLLRSTEEPDWFVDLVPLFHFYPEALLASERWSRTEELLPGIGSLPVDEIYVELQIVEEAEFEQERKDRGEGAVDLATMRRALRENLDVLSVPGEQLLHGRHRHMAVVGDPGSGKTTLLKWCALKMLREPDGRWLLPLPVSLREYALDAKPGENIERFALRRLASVEGPEADKLLNLLHYLSGVEKETAVFLLDGWDEVPPERRETLRGEIDTLSLAYAFILTSRRVGFPRGMPVSETYAIVDLDVARVDDLVRRWYAGAGGQPSEGAETGAAAEDLIQQLDRRPDLAELSRNPFLLTLLCLLHSRAQGQNALPATRAEVYAQVIDHVREEFNRRYPDRRFGEKDLDALSEFALYLFSEADKLPVQLFRRAHFDAFAKRDGVSPVLLDRVWKDSRLLSRWERTEETLHFVHLTFQEFLAARALAKRDDKEVAALLARRGRETRWREVWRFYAGLKSGRDGGQSARGLVRDVHRRKDRFHYYLAETASLLAETGARDGGLELAGEDIRPLLWDAWRAAWHPKPFVKAMALLDPEWFVERAIEEAEQPEGLDLQVMANLIRLIGRLGTERAGRWLAESCFDEENQTVSVIAAAAMAACVGKDGRTKLRAWLASPPRGAVRIHAIRALGEARDFPSLDLLDAIARDRSKAHELEAMEAVKAIGKIGGPRARKLLLDLLDRDPRRLMRETAVDGLKSLRDRLTAAALLARLDPSMEPSLKLAFLEALSMTPIGAGAGVLDRYRRPEHEPDPHLRAQALHALAEAADGRVPDWLIGSARSDPDPEVREAAVSALRERARPTDFDFLAEAALGNGSPDLRASALDAIGELARKFGAHPKFQRIPAAAAGVVSATLSRSHSGAEAASAARIARHLGKRVADALLDVLKDGKSDPLVVEEAAWTAGRLRLQEAMPFLARWWKRRKRGKPNILERLIPANLSGEDSILFDPSDRAAMACAEAAAGIDPLFLLNDGSEAAKNALAHWAGLHDALVFEGHIILPSGETIGIRLKAELEHKEPDGKQDGDDSPQHRLVVDMDRRKVFYRSVEVISLPPRDLVCLCILAQHPGVALPVKTIYQMAVEQGIDGGRFDIGASLPKPKAIRFAIRAAIRAALDAKPGTKADERLNKEIDGLFDSRRDRAITLQIPKDEVSVTGLPKKPAKSAG